MSDNDHYLTRYRSVVRTIHGVVPFNVRTYYGGKAKTRHNLGTKSLCAVSNIRLVYYTDTQTDKLTTVIRPAHA